MRNKTSAWIEPSLKFNAIKSCFVFVSKFRIAFSNQNVDVARNFNLLWIKLAQSYFLCNAMLTFDVPLDSFYRFVFISLTFQTITSVNTDCLAVFPSTDVIRRKFFGILAVCAVSWWRLRLQRFMSNKGK